MYLNQIYFGHGVYGVTSAAKFFRQDVKNLTVVEAALHGWKYVGTQSFFTAEKSPRRA